MNPQSHNVLKLISHSGMRGGRCIGYLGCDLGPTPKSRRLSFTAGLVRQETSTLSGPLNRRAAKEDYVADDPNKTWPQDAQRVNVHQDHELRYWSQKFGVSPEQLKRVVGRVGPMADDVERALSASKADTNA
jgi:hypothetical protein